MALDLKLVKKRLKQARKDAEFPNTDAVAAAERRISGEQLKKWESSNLSYGAFQVGR